MKKIALYLFCAAQLLSSCYEVEQDNPLVVGTCMDKIKNQNEEGVDCGGVCNACVIVAPVKPINVPCESKLTANHITFEGVDYAVTASNSYTEQTDDVFLIVIALDGYDEQIIIELYGTLPKVSTTYNLASWLYMGRGEASITYDGLGNPRDVTGGKLYLNYLNGTPFVEVCPVTLTDGGYYPVEFFGKISCAN